MVLPKYFDLIRVPRCRVWIGFARINKVVVRLKYYVETNKSPASDRRHEDGPDEEAEGDEAFDDVVYDE